MSKYGQWMLSMQSAAVLCGYLIILLSLRPNARRRILMAVLYSLSAIGLAVLTVFPYAFGISMANAFGPSRVSPLTYVTPCLISAFFIIPAVALFPLVSTRTAKRVGFITFVVILPVLLAIGTVSVQAGHSPGHGAFIIPRGLEALALSALWLRVHECRLPEVDA